MYDTNVVSGKYGFFDTGALVLLTAPVQYEASLSNEHTNCRQSATQALSSDAFSKATLTVRAYTRVYARSVSAV